MFGKIYICKIDVKVNLVNKFLNRNFENFEVKFKVIDAEGLGP